MSTQDVKNWRKYCGKSLVVKIEELDPAGMYIEAIDNYLIKATIITREGSTGIGWSICSAVDTFDLNKGVPKAVGRAIRAIEMQETSLPVRKHIWVFPNTWTMKMVRRIVGSCVHNKSVYTAPRTK